MTTSMHFLHAVLILALSACLKPSDCERIVPPMILHSVVKDGIIHSNLMCPSSGSDNKTYIWRLPDNTTRNTGRNNSYSPAMCGVHRCLVTNAAGTDISNTMNVTGCWSNPHVAHECIVDRNQGQYVVLDCTTPPGHPFRSHKKSWKLITNSNINKPISNNSKTFLAEDGTLVVLRLSADDSGQYVCEAFNQSAMKKVDIAKYHVNVNSEDGSIRENKLELVYFSSDINTVENSSFSLFCIFSESNFSNQSSVFWEVRSSKGASHSLENESKIFKKVQVNDSGNVTCSRKGDLSHVISLRVRALPQCSEKFTSQNISRGQNVSFTCLDSLQLRPHFHLQWFVNGSHVEEFDNRSNITLPQVSSSFVVTVNISNGLQNRFQSAYAMVDDIATTTTATSTTTTSTTSTTTTSTTRFLPTTTRLVSSFPYTIKSTEVEVTIATRPRPIGYEFFSPDKQTTTNSETTSYPPPEPNVIVFVVVGVSAAVGLIIIIIPCYCCCKKKLSRKRKQEHQNSIPAPSVEPLVLANLANNDVPPQAPQLPPPNNQLVNQRHNGNDDDSMSLRSSDSGFSDPTNEPLLKSNEQLNSENKSKSDSEREGLNERPAVLLCAGV